MPPPPSTTHHRRNLSADPTPSTSIHEISTHFTNLYLNHKASTSITLTKSQSQRTRPNPHYTKEENDPQRETIKKAIVISKKKPMKDNNKGYVYLMSQNEEMRTRLKIGYGIRRRSFGCSLESEVSEFLVFNGVKVVAADMPPFMQVHAVDVTRKTHDSLEKFTAKTLALTLKKVSAKSTSSEAAREESFLAGEEHSTIQGSACVQNIHGDSIPSLGVCGETQIDDDREKGTQTPSDGEDKTDFSSMCPTGRISFKLYDWNPAEFPRRLRHQIFQWLGSMPVELEGYIRPGCIILTFFIAMPRFMWVKLNEDPVVCIYDLLALPKNMLLRRDTFYINLNSMIFSVMRGGRSVIKIEAGEKAPKLHYVQPTCFKAGKPINFLACGSNLLQPRLRFLVSFAGKYMKNEVRVSPLHTQSEASITNFNHQFLSICVPYTELDVFGPGFIEVENESGVSNFIPILVADEEVCSEIKIMQMKYCSRLYARDSESTSTTKSCEVHVNKFSEMLVDIAWLLKQPFVEDMECAMMSWQLQRFSFVLKFLMEYESTVVLRKVLDLVKMKMNKNSGIIEADSEFQGTVNYATEVINQQLERKPNLDLLPRDQDMVRAESMQIPSAGHKSEHVALLNGDCATSVMPYTEPPEKPFNRMFTYNAIRLFMSCPLILAVAMIAICFGPCSAVVQQLEFGTRQLLPMDDQDINNLHASSSNSNVRKHDPRMACSSYLAAGQIACACPELDAQLEAEEEEKEKQKSKTTKMTFTNAIMKKCQVPGCKADISELKGYHKRHRVCLTCANASNVVIDGIHKRYCQQCGNVLTSMYSSMGCHMIYNTCSIEVMALRKFMLRTCCLSGVI
ncbi:SBP-like protein [Artemisia annua]|uniref:SBP-like protein n=1 Tax=Artemisia annua TaxID=35608 RepID=A0A2U1L7N9_ARTAN|nr:SBP-like protein [Artemisia annua]